MSLFTKISIWVYKQQKTSKTQALVFEKINKKQKKHTSQTSNCYLCCNIHKQSHKVDQFKIRDRRQLEQ